MEQRNSNNRVKFNIMNIRELLGLILLFVFVVSCSKESPIDEHPYKTGAFTLNFVMNDGMNTKAAMESTTSNGVPGHAEGYLYSTTDELNVDNCFIAIFAKGTDDMWSKKIWTKFYDGINSDNGTFAISDLILPIKTDLKVIVIANCKVSDGDINITSIGKSMSDWTYLDWETASALHTGFNEVKDYYTFNPRTLIKKGECVMRFNALGQLVNGSDEVIADKPVVSLFQLAAKVRLNLNVYNNMYFKQTNGIQKDKSSYGVCISNVNLYTGILNPKVTLTYDNYYKSASESISQKIDNIVFYTYEQPHSVSNESGLTVELTGQMKKSMDDVFSAQNLYTIYINPTAGLVRGNYYEVTGTLKMEQKFPVDLNYEVMPWNELTVNIPTFE